MVKIKPEMRIGSKFERLLIVDIETIFSPKHNQTISYAICECDCGKIKKIAMSSIVSKHTRSCGCLHKEFLLSGKARRRHGHRGKYADTHPIYAIWKGMMNRCYSRKSSGYKKYGEKGIDVCERWHIYENFYADMSPMPENTSIDRIDNLKGYSPQNCRWATKHQQARNRSSVRKIEIMGEIKTLPEWCEFYGIVTSRVVLKRLKRGWDIQSALITPKRARREP